MLPVLELGVTHPWAKEAENAWVFRCLDIDPGKSGSYSLRDVCLSDEDSFVDLKSNDEGEKEPRWIFVPRTRAQVIHSWAHGAVDNPGHGVVVVIVGPQGFLLQRKDDLHPNEACRGRYSLFGGSCGEGEDPKVAAMREVYEEIRNVVLADTIASRMIKFGECTLPSVQWPGNYHVTIFVARCSGEEFLSWSSSIMSRDGLAESNPALLSRREFDVYHQDECKQSGTHFVASHNVILNCVRG